ncbi:Sec1/munc18-like (SM) proteins superfamily [Theobroma cacao]|uniref:Sec1/munc18-like (SM) proteins superfamily n=1 Tax=Theobroma cacao TaxID=3641 RepID=A0A061FK46_THECC|nr:Sec1/munc18-like (SM) proteins superfamily [Theobroma cacao]
MSVSSYGSEYKNFKQVTRERLLHDMLRSTKTADSKSTWKFKKGGGGLNLCISKLYSASVLIVDKFTVKIMSYAFKMKDITNEGVSLVEDINRKRQPLTFMDAIYFIQPSKENITMLLSDMSGRTPLYRKASVFFSSAIAGELVNYIKKDTILLPCITLKEMDLEYFAIDSQSFITADESALEDLFGFEENTYKGDRCLNVMATRIASVFASLREFPLIRYRAAKSIDATTPTTFCDLIPTKLAAGVWNHLMKYKQIMPNFPQAETCDLLILDRSVDQIAPVIHEWFYDAMCHDLLDIEGNKYVREVCRKSSGPLEKKEVLLDEDDPVWLELRHAHIADASERLHEKMTNFIAKYEDTQIHCSRYGGELSARNLQKMVQALPQYSEQIDKLSLHVEIAGNINKMITNLRLKELGELEQDLIFGGAGIKDVIKFFKINENTTREDKLRLLMILAAIYPEELEGEKGLNWMKLAKLPAEDMSAVNNMKLLGGSPDAKKSFTGIFSLKFDFHKRRHVARKERIDVEETWQLSRFYPMIEELIENLSNGELSEKEYPCLNGPSATSYGSSPTSHVHQGLAHSTRSRRTPTWAKRQNVDDKYSSDSVLKHASSDLKRMGRRIFVFIAGGATRSELRVCHKLTNKLKREIVLGSSSLDDPSQFVSVTASSYHKLKQLAAHELSLDVRKI